MKSVGVRILSQFDLCVNSGEAVACLGASGSGKSTLLMAMAGLLPYTGEITICGRDVRDTMKHDPRWFHRQIGLAMQFPERGFFAPSIIDELTFTSKLLKMRSVDIDAQVQKILRKVGLTGVSTEISPFMLSGGEKRRLALAAAIIHDPRIIFFDEPDAGLDWKGKSLVAGLINDMVDAGKTVIVATHDIGWAMKWADRFVSLHEGRLDVFAQLTDLHLDHDATHALFLRLKEVGVIEDHPYRNEEDFFRAIENTIRRCDRIGPFSDDVARQSSQ